MNWNRLTRTVGWSLTGLLALAFLWVVIGEIIEEFTVGTSMSDETAKLGYAVLLLGVSGALWWRWQDQDRSVAPASAATVTPILPGLLESSATVATIGMLASLVIALALALGASDTASRYLGQTFAVPIVLVGWFLSPTPDWSIWTGFGLAMVVMMSGPMQHMVRRNGPTA